MVTLFLCDPDTRRHFGNRKENYQRTVKYSVNLSSFNGSFVLLKFPCSFLLCEEALV